MIEVYAPKPKNKYVAWNPIAVVTVTLDATGTVIGNIDATNQGVGINASGKLATGINVTINGLDAGKKYTLNMQAQNATGQISKVTKISALTAKYAAPKKAGAVINTSGSKQVTFGWSRPTLRGIPAASAVTGYEIGIYDTVTKDFVFASDTGAKAERYAILVTNIGITGLGIFDESMTNATITGLLSQKYTFGVREIATLANGDIAKSAILKFTMSVK